MRWRLLGAAAAIALSASAVRPAAALDLPAALRDVDAGNPMLGARRAMADAARERVAPAGAWASPMAMAGVQNVPTTGRLDQDMMTMKVVGLTQRVPVFGANRLARRAASEAAVAARARAGDARHEALGAALASYGAAYFAAERARVAEAHGAIMARMVEAARARYRAGTGRLEDVLRAQAEQARVAADLAGFRAEERAARARLDALRGAEPDADRSALEAPKLAEVLEDPAAWRGAISPANPRLAAADAEVARAGYAARAARRMVWPDLELSGEYGRRETLRDGMKQDDMFSARVGFMVPLFAGGRELREAAEMDAMGRAASFERRAAELELRAEVSAAHSAAVAAQTMAHLLADTVVVVQSRAVEASWAAYAAGTVDLWRVFESNHALYAEEIDLTRARESLVDAQARFLTLTGRADVLGLALPDAEEDSR